MPYHRCRGCSFYSNMSVRMDFYGILINWLTLWLYCSLCPKANREPGQQWFPWVVSQFFPFRFQVNIDAKIKKLWSFSLIFHSNIRYVISVKTIFLVTLNSLETILTKHFFFFWEFKIFRRISKNSHILASKNFHYHQLPLLLNNHRFYFPRCFGPRNSRKIPHPK